MKKIISLILTVAMLLSMTTFVAPVSAETEVNDLFMADASREAFLNSKRSQPVELYLFQDIFSTFEERQKNADWYSWSAGNISTIWPYKGIGSGIEPKYPLVRSGVANDFTMMIDLQDGASTYTTGMDLKSNPLVSYNDDVQRYFVNVDGVSYKLGEIAEGKKGGNFATFGVKYDTQSNNIADGIGIKEQILNTDVYPNIGTSTQIQKAIYPVNRAGVAELNILLTSPAMNDKTRAARVPCTIRYADGTEEKIALIVASINADGQGSIVAVPKQYTTYTELAANDVEARSVVGKDITNEELTIPSISGKNYIAEKSFVLATFMRNYVGGELAGYVHSFSIPVDPAKTIQSVTFEKNSTAIIGHYSENVPSKTTSTDMYTFVPVTIEGAPTDTYNYYLHVTRSCGSSGIFAMSTSYETYQSKIDAIEARIEALDAQYNSAQKLEIAEIKNAIQSLESEGVLESDYDQALITKLDDLYQSAEAEIKAAQIAAVEVKITDMAFNYVSSMRSQVEGIKAEYEALINSGILSSEFNQDLLAKFGAVYEVYEVSSAVEDKVAEWGNEYLHTMYNEVIAAKEVADEYMPDGAESELTVIAVDTIKKIDSMNTLALAGSKIDDKIGALSLEYSIEMLDTLIEIKADVDAFYGIGGTDKGLANAEIFNSLYEAAAGDLLQRDIDNVVAKIEALPEIYSTAIDGEMTEIQAEIKAIETKGGVIPSTALAKYAKLVAQRDEEPAYTTFEIPYNRDVFESLKRYQDQYRDKNGSFVKNELGHFEPQVEKLWTFAAFIYSESTLDEDSFFSKLGIDAETNKATINGVPYQFGKIRSEVDGVINESNAFSSTTSKTTVIDVANNVYSKIHAAMWAYNDSDGVTITYKYADGSSSTEANVTKVAGGRSSVSPLTNTKSSVYKVMNNDAKASVSFYRAYNPAFDTGAPGGGYTIAIVEHILTPDDQKILDKIEITFATTGANLFAMTGQIANSGLLNKVLEDSVNALDTTKEENIRSVLEGCTNIMGALDAKEVEYKEELAQKISETNKKFVAIESVERYTDLDNMTFTVKFTGPISEASINKENFILNKLVKASTGTRIEKVLVKDYELKYVAVNGEIKEVKVIFENNFNYDEKYELSISEEITGVLGNAIIEDIAEFAYDAKPAIEAELIINENGTGSVKIVNNMKINQEVTAVVAVYNKNNQMKQTKIINKVLASGEPLNEPIACQVGEGETVECLIIDTLTNCRKLYNTLVK